MGTEKRARQKANRQARLAEVEAETTKEVRESATKRIGTIAAVIAGIVGLIVLYSVLTGDDAEELQPFDFSDPEAETVDAPELLTSVPDDFVPFGGTGALADVAPEARNGAYDAPPAMTIDTDKDYAAAIITDAGTFRFTLFDDQAPVTVNNFVNLARDGYYNGVLFHRVLPDFMAQGGDPTGIGSGGPGYTFEDEFVNELAFDRAGLLAMANSGPATNGSQFFVTFMPTDGLTGVHTIFGELISDVTELDSIVRVDPNNSDPSIVPTVITSVRIVES